jgi:glycosyltransferase involved in cell wall biosynthesis
MHLCFLLPNLGGGGAERTVLLIAGKFAERGHRVTVLTISDGGPLAEILPNAVRYQSFGQSSPTRAILPFLKFKFRERPDFIFSALDNANLLNCIAQRILRTRKIAVSIHTTLSVRYTEPMPDDMRKRIARMRKHLPVADTIVCVSEASRQDAVRFLQVDDRKTRLIYNPSVSPEILARSSPRPQVPFERYALFAGRLIPDKRVDEILNALTLIPEMNLVILGVGEEEDSLKQLTSTLGLDARVYFAGFDPDPYRWIQHAELVVLASRREGLPTILSESLAFRKKIVSVDMPSGANEILQGGKYGWLVTDFDRDAFTAALRDAWHAAPRDIPDAAWEPFTLDYAFARYETMVNER